MGKFQLLILLSVVTCAIISTVESVPVKDSSIQKQNADKCKQLCGSCSCTGYFCGDECLCECNSRTDGEAECVDTMKSNCKKLELPFEVLIQGPNVNRMVRSLLYADPNAETCTLQSSESNQKQRSTVRIYKPDAIEQVDEVLSAPTAPIVDIPSDEHDDDSPIHIIVAQNLDPNVAPVTDEDVMVLPSDDGSNIESENQEIALQKDDVDRINTKRHIIDINQDIHDIDDINDYMRDLEESFIYKRDTEGEKKEEVKEEVKEENVGAAAPSPASPAPLLPRVREAIQNIRSQIPTSAEIKTAWEGIQNDFTVRVNSAIADAKKRAEELRAKITPPPATPAPAVIKPLPMPVPLPVAPPPPPPAPAPAKFNPFLRAENEEGDVGMALPVAPVVPSIPLITLPIQAEIAKGMATFRANNKLIQNTVRAEAKEVISHLSKNGWLITPPLLVGSTHEEGEEKKDEKEAEKEEKKEEKKEE